MRIPVASGCLIVLMVAGAMGCGGRETYPVSGIVKLTDGTPLPGGRIILTGGASGAHGRIGEDGSFTLGTFRVNDGAKPGEYKVVIVGATEPDTRTYDEISHGLGQAPRSLIHSKYADAKTSDLRLEIVRGKNHLTLEVEPRESSSR
jgi:hypothetical protein